ncbi:hypothetical protein Tco_1323907 [Tanacetum coccineum]
MAILKSHAGWKSKDFRGMTFEQIEEKFIPVWKQLQDFVPMNFKTESERVKRPGIQLAQESSKRLKTAKASGSEPSQEHQTKDSKELSEEELKKMMEIVPVEEVYIEALQAKYPIIEWEIYSKEQRKYWKIIRVGNHTEVYQTFEEMLKRFDREDLDRLWSLVKKTFSTTDPTEDKEKELWVELKRLYEPDPRDQLWALQKYMHDPLEWRLYDTCGVHHVSTRRGHEIFMLVEKDYPLKKGLTTYSKQSKMTRCLEASSPGSFPLLEYFPTTSKVYSIVSESFPLLMFPLLEGDPVRSPCAIKGVLSLDLSKVLHPQVVSNIMKHSSDRCERLVTKLIEFIRVHQPVSLVFVEINDSLRVFVCSIWGQVGDVGSKCLGLGEIKLLLVAFDSQLKVFHPLKNDNASDELPQCHIQVEDDTFL